MCPVLGATAYWQGDFPVAFESAGIRRREPLRNTYLGITTTRPEEDVAAFGFAYEDRKSNSTDEDVYTLHLRSHELTFWRGRSWEQRDPRYGGTHHGEKLYFEK